MTIECEIKSENDMGKLARLFHELLPAHAIVALDGTLGAGKTRFVQFFAEACGVDPSEVTSPTFTLWQTYQAERVIHHLDAYRIADEDEFDALGFEDCFEAQAVTFLEWASRVEACLPPSDRIAVHFEVTSENSRIARITASEGLEQAIKSGYDTTFS